MTSQSLHEARTVWMLPGAEWAEWKPWSFVQVYAGLGKEIGCVWKLHRGTSDQRRARTRRGTMTRRTEWTQTRRRTCRWRTGIQSVCCYKYRDLNLKFCDLMFALINNYCLWLITIKIINHLIQHKYVCIQYSAFRLLHFYTFYYGAVFAKMPYKISFT